MRRSRGCECKQSGSTESGTAGAIILHGGAATKKIVCMEGNVG